MSKTPSASNCFAKCRTCGATFPATLREDGTIKPNGVPAECSCGDADFCRLATPGDV